MILKRFQNGAGAPLTYLVGDPASGTAVLIDPGNDVQAYLRAAAQLKLEIGHVFANGFGRKVPLGLLELRAMHGMHVHVSARTRTPGDISSLLPGCTLTIGSLRIRLLQDEAGAESIAVFDLEAGGEEPVLVASPGRVAA